LRGIHGNTGLHRFRAIALFVTVVDFEGDRSPSEHNLKQYFLTKIFLTKSHLYMFFQAKDDGTVKRFGRIVLTESKKKLGYSENLAGGLFKGNHNVEP
jgi:hypothetical protein